jgi:hypothetical protein
LQLKPDPLDGMNQLTALAAIAIACIGAAADDRPNPARAPLVIDFGACTPEEQSVIGRNGSTDYKVLGPTGETCLLEYSLFYEMVATQVRCAVPRSLGVVSIVTRDAGQPGSGIMEFCTVVESE